MKKSIKEKTLTKEEFLELELRHVQSDLAKKEQDMVNLKRELLVAKKNLLTYMHKDVDAELSELANVKQNLSKKSDKMKADREKFIGKVKKRLKIKGRFGYNPDTLTVIED